MNRRSGKEDIGQTLKHNTVGFRKFYFRPKDYTKTAK